MGTADMPGDGLERRQRFDACRTRGGAGGRSQGQRVEHAIGLGQVIDECILGARDRAPEHLRTEIIGRIFD